NRIMAIVSAVALFLFFKNLPMRHNRLINLAATATFGVLLIHTHSDLSPWLWGDILNVKGHFASHLLWLHAVAACVGIYLVCVIIDLLRQRLLERPLFNWLDTRFPSLNTPH
ncbi:MAG: acyltransferase, partial [Muribaculaceae bacterium]|nr:acyltransferase [Muribaculaceae bacterium]